MEKTKDQIKDNTKEENSMIINESKNTFMPTDKKELRYLEQLADRAIAEYKAGKCKPYKDFKW
ncbi:MAG: hypothetical protein IJ525_03120 [Alphaproteobacteria bacterium]|nr:hypothetical protein [Alphaproteobacteria bacterium]